MSNVIPHNFDPLFEGPGRHYWGRHGTSCPRCWKEYKRIALNTPEMTTFFREAKKCQECAGTQRDALPWTELFKTGRGAEWL